MPIRWSDTFEDRTSLRLTHFQQLSGTELLLLKGRLEISGLAIGTLELLSKDVDVRMLSLATFLERKINGKNSNIFSMLKQNLY